MKTEEHPGAIAVFIQRVTAAVSELKDHLQQDYERTYPDLGEIIRIVLDEEEAKAWELSFFPHLFLPDMAESHIANLNLQPVETKHEDVFERLIGRRTVFTMSESDCEEQRSNLSQAPTLGISTASAWQHLGRSPRR